MLYSMTTIYIYKVHALTHRFTVIRHTHTLASYGTFPRESFLKHVYNQQTTRL